MRRRYAEVHHLFVGIAGWLICDFMILIKGWQVYRANIRTPRLHIARIDNECLVGGAAVRPMHKPDIYEMKRLCLRERWRGRGIGGQLVETALIRVRGRLCKNGTPCGAASGNHHSYVSEARLC